MILGTDVTAQYPAITNIRSAVASNITAVRDCCGGSVRPSGIFGGGLVMFAIAFVRKFNSVVHCSQIRVS
jgi:hypothetical protein